MYKEKKKIKSSIRRNTSYVAETIERKVEKMLESGEPLESQLGQTPIYTEKKEGVIEAYNIRTDRFEIALDAVDKVHKSIKAKSEKNAKAKSDNEPKKDGGAEPTDGTNI
jgi:hypothetical protein